MAEAGGGGGGWVGVLILVGSSKGLLVFSVTPFKIDQNKNQNRSIDKVDKVRNLKNERKYIYKNPR